MKCLPGSATEPVSWVLSGPRVAALPGRVDAHITRALAQRHDAACLRCGETELTGAQIEALVSQLARRLRGARIGVHVSRSLASVIVTLAAWRAGAAYVPLPTDVPTARTLLVTERCALDMVVSDTLTAIDGYRHDGADASLDRPLQFHLSGQINLPSAETPAYVAHTSGSTGAPKGVRVGHAALLNRLQAMRRLLAAGPDDRIIYKTSSVFDVHVWEFALPLMLGGLCVIYPQQRQFDLFSVASLIMQREVTIFGMVPSLLDALLTTHRLAGAQALRAVLCGGEAWSPRLAAKFYAQLPHCRLYNSYGPTETTIAVSNWPVPNDKVPERILLGAPLDNLHFRISERSREAAVVTGMLDIGGTQVAGGYLDPADDDRAAFYDMALDGESLRWFRTGDLVRLETASGQLSFVGREDSQIKLNGMRIELEEIESVIASVATVEACVVVVSRDGPTPQLWAAVAMSGDAPLPTAALRAACARVLPLNHVPTMFAKFGAFPLRPSGKIDRAAVLQTLQAQRRS